MSLLQQPPEMLLRILEFVGSRYFQEDMGRLTICKQWFACAQGIYLTDLELNPKTLRRMAASPDAEGLIRANTECLNLKTKGFEDWYDVPVTREFSLPGHPMEASVSFYESERAVITAWTKSLHEDLLRLAAVVSGARKLRIIRIEALGESHPTTPHIPSRDYLALSSIRSLILAKNLTVLELDAGGSGLLEDKEDGTLQRSNYMTGWSGRHLCPNIGGLLVTLRRLHLRMRSVCTAALTPPNDNVDLPLREVILDLSLTNILPETKSAHHAVRCEMRLSTLLGLQLDFGQQARALAARMASPKTFRILTHSLPQLEKQSYDVLTGKCTGFMGAPVWEEDGKSIRVQISESGSTYDDSSSSSDEE